MLMNRLPLSLDRRDDDSISERAARLGMRAPIAPSSRSISSGVGSKASIQLISSGMTAPGATATTPFIPDPKNVSMAASPSIVPSPAPISISMRRNGYL